MSHFVIVDEDGLYVSITDRIGFGEPRKQLSRTENLDSAVLYDEGILTTLAKNLASNEEARLHSYQRLFASEIRIVKLLYKEKIV